MNPWLECVELGHGRSVLYEGRDGSTHRGEGEIDRSEAVIAHPAEALHASVREAWDSPDADLAERLRRLRTHGGARQYHHEEIGTNSRLDTLQAAVLLKKLVHLERWSAARREHAEVYSAALRGLDGVEPPAVDPANEHIYHQYTVRAARRDELKQHLADRGIGSAVYYPKALHLQPCFAPLGYEAGSLPQAERACGEVLSLPVYPELATEQRDAVIDATTEFYR